MAFTARSHPALALAVASVLTLAGCAGAADPGGASSSETTATTQAPTPDASASPSPASPKPSTGSSADPSMTATIISAPADGSTVAGPAVEVTGTGTAVEGNLRWRVLRSGSTDVVTEDFTTAGANGVVGPYTFTVTLTPGSYTLEVWEPSMSDGGAEDAAMARTTSTFTVT